MFVRYKAPYELVKGHEYDSGYDIRATEDINIKPLETVLIPIGVCLELPSYTEAQVRPKSSLSSQGLLVHFGTIDAGYRGEVKVAMTNLSGGLKTFEVRQKIAQIVFGKVEDIALEKAEEIEANTSRGKGGFGSTGKF